MHPRWTLDRKWIPHGEEVDLMYTRFGFLKDRKWVPDGLQVFLRIDRKWIPGQTGSGFLRDRKWISGWTGSAGVMRESGVVRS